jgi:hypothetical protein
LKAFSFLSYAIPDFADNFLANGCSAGTQSGLAVQLLASFFKQFSLVQST